MTKWIADYEVVSHLSLATNDLKLKYIDPANLNEIHIKNLSIKPPLEKPLLSLQVILENEDIEGVQDKSREYLKYFLNLLSLVTNSKFEIHRLIRIIDWTPGIDMRDCHQFLEAPDPNIPFPLLETKFLDSVSTLMKSSGINDDLRRALRWFSRGVGASYLDEQFQYFWFALETIAEKDKDRSKVPDQCPKCSGPLYCEACKETPMHRPFPKQAIEQLIKKVVKVDPEKLYASLSKIRNALLHGDDTDEIEKALLVDMSKLVDILGKVVWVSLINSFKPPTDSNGFAFLKANMYSHRKIVTTAVMKLGSGACKDNPEIESVAKVDIKMHVHDDHDVKS